jgi:hypothetical protein
MAVKIAEKHKLYVLIIMVFIAVVIGYFRFLHPSAATGKQTPASEPTGVQADDLSAVPGPTQVQSRRPAQRSVPQLQISRNIFEPAGPLPVSAMPPTAPSVPAAEVDITLSGTIIGDHSSIAIINNQFMRRGQKLGKCQIMRITADRVYLACGDEQRVLDIVSVTQAITE